MSCGLAAARTTLNASSRTATASTSRSTVARAGRTWDSRSRSTSGAFVIDPRNSDVVYVAAQGPLWRKGGDRGVYKTTDGGKTWTKILGVDDWTGANDIQLDPRNPDVLVATTWQRNRRVFAFIAGGPGSGVHRSTDGGKTWTKSQSGFPSEDLGRIGLSMSPADPSVVYAIADAANGKGGFFRSRDGGASWERMGGFQSGGNYYNEVFADPKNVDRVYAVDVLLQVSDDGGRTFRRVGENLKHVDNHSVWIDPDATDHLIVGCDGGVYETFDRGRTWRFSSNLPITQYYRVATDESKPFYRIFGGAQDNFSVGGPSRTRTNNGIRNADWFITSGGDGFGSVVDPADPTTVYAESQFGVLSRFNLKTGEFVGIQPFDDTNGRRSAGIGTSPLFVSPHSHTRIYFAANRVFRSDDRGDSWRPVSPDITRQIDRNTLKAMDRIWSVDAVAKNASTTLFGTIVNISESPVKEGVLFAGTDDGRISITENGGASWRHTDKFPGVPDTSYVSHVIPSNHDVNTVYATFQNHQSGDFKPYVVKSTDLGRTWTNITGDLPARGSTWSIAEDHVDRNLLFVGTEFGLFFTKDGGKKWVQLKGGMPTIQVRDLAIQRRENDLVVATFGRGFYVLDDYTPLRSMTEQTLAQNAVLFPVKAAPLYVESTPLGLPGASFQGHGYYMAANPPFGATFTYYLKDAIESRKTVRQKAEAALAKKNADVPFPAWDTLKVEDRQEDPAVVVTVSDANGQVVRRFTASTTAGINRATWDLRLQPTDPINGPPFKVDPDYPFNAPPVAPFAPPGTLSSLASQACRRSIHSARHLAALSGGRRRQRSRPRDGDARRPEENRGARTRGARNIRADRRDLHATRLSQASDRRDAGRGYIARAARALPRGRTARRTRIARGRSDAREAERSIATVTARPFAGSDRQRVEQLTFGVERFAARPGRYCATRIRRRAVACASARRRRPQGARAIGGGGWRAVDERSHSAAACLARRGSGRRITRKGEIAADKRRRRHRCRFPIVS